jgi:hypothetical protein
MSDANSLDWLKRELLLVPAREGSGIQRGNCFEPESLSLLAAASDQCQMGYTCTDTTELVSWLHLQENC